MKDSKLTAFIAGLGVGLLAVMVLVMVTTAAGSIG